VPEAEVAEAESGFKSLYTGVDLSGWKVEPNQQLHWTAKDWNLICDGKVEGENKNLVSEKSYSDFGLVIDWKTPANPVPQQVPIVLGGVIPDAKIDKKPNEWNRALIRFEAGKTKISVNDARPIDGPPIAAKEIPIILLHRPEGISFANLYIRSLAGQTSPAR